MTLKFNHVGISVSDIERSIDFYRELLGMEQLCEVFPFGGEQFSEIMDIPGVEGRMCMIGKGSLQLELFEFSNPKPADKNPEYLVSDRGYSHFGVEVDDIDATYEKLRAANVRIHSPVKTFMGGGMRAAYCRDSDGNVFELLQPGKPREQ
ncbi:MAG: VOC family protein [Novosphingobium sp.]|nr:VOC family protein [Novosphingobium sp.]